MTPTDEQIRLAIAEQAADWFVAHRTETLDEGGREAFTAWLKASPVHVEEYLRMAAISGELRHIALDSRLPVEAWIAEATSQAQSVEAQRADAPGSDSRARNVVLLRRGSKPLARKCGRRPGQR